jgi:molecular chaperone GrpE
MKRKRKDKNPAEDNGTSKGFEDEGMPEDPTKAFEEIQRLRSENKTLEEKLTRLMADLTNIRRRQAEELLRARETSMERLASELLPIVDSFELALKTGGDRDSILEGIQMVHSMLTDMMGRHGIHKIPALETPFDPTKHEALAVQDNREFPHGTVLQVHQEGYEMGDRILRPARVVVSQNPGKNPQDSSDNSSDSNSGNIAEENDKSGAPEEN